MDSKQEVEVEMEQEQERGIMIVGCDVGIDPTIHRAVMAAARDIGCFVYIGDQTQISPVDEDIIEGATLTINGKEIECFSRIVGKKQSPTKSLCSKLKSGEVIFDVSDSDRDMLYQFALRVRCIRGDAIPRINQHGGRGKGDRIRRRKQFIPHKSINKGRR